ncbi:MAG: YfhO family protein [Limisphaerales bacterium]
MLFVAAGWTISMCLVGYLNVEGEATEPIFVNGIVRFALLLSCWGLACAWRKQLATRWSPWLAVGVVLVLWGDLKTQQPQLTPTIDRSNYTEAIPLAPQPGVEIGRTMLTARALGELKFKSLPSLAQTTVLHRLSLFDNLNLLEGVSKMDGLFSLYLPRQQEIESLVYAGPNEVRGPLADFLGISHLSSPTNIFTFEPRSTAMPLITAGQSPVFLPAEEIPGAMAAPEFAPRTVVFLPLQLQDGASTGPNIEIRSSRITAHRIEIEVNAESDGIVTIAQAHYHQWRATIDGEPTEILPANHAFQAVAVKTGEHRIVLEYHDTAWITGRATSLLTLLALGILAFFWRPKETVASP